MVSGISTVRRRDSSDVKKPPQWAVWGLYESSVCKRKALYWRAPVLFIDSAKSAFESNSFAKFLAPSSVNVIVGEWLGSLDRSPCNRSKVTVTIESPGEPSCIVDVAGSTSAPPIRIISFIFAVGYGLCGKFLVFSKSGASELTTKSGSRGPLDLTV